MVSKLIIIIMIQRLKTFFCLGMAARYDNFKDHKTFINALEICNKKYQIFIVTSWERNKLS